MTKTQLLTKTLFLCSFIVTQMSASQTVYTSAASFISSTGSNTVVDFNDVNANTAFPFTSDGVGFSGGYAAVQDPSNTFLPESFWFGGQGTSPNFLLVNTASAPLTILFSRDVTAFGFLLAPFATNNFANNDGMVWNLLSDSNSSVGDGTTVYNFVPSYSYATSSFLGVTSTTPFRSVTIARTDVNTGQLDGGSFFINDVRSAAAIPEPSSAGLMLLAFLAAAMFIHRAKPATITTADLAGVRLD